MARVIGILALGVLLSGCIEERAPSPSPPSVAEAHRNIDRALPPKLSDRDGWTQDIYDGFTALGLEITPQNACAVAAVIAQESSFQVDPVVPDMGKIAWAEIDRRAQHVLIPTPMVHGVLQLKSSTGKSYGERINAARTEKDLSDIYEDFIASVPLGRTLFESRNPIRTRGPMQVNVAFADRFSATHTYPYPVNKSIDDELFTRRGSVYFGIAHLLAYRAPYDSYLYRFADYNAGQFSSRNAAFQQAVSTASHRSLVADGALLPRDEGGFAVGNTETAVRSLGPRVSLSQTEIHTALATGRSEEFEGTALYRRTFALADQTGAHSLPRAILPQIDLEGPKLSHKLTTSWYAHRVEGRYNRCLNPNGAGGG
jgi:Protein of unknown function (DUF1615)